MAFTIPNEADANVIDQSVAFASDMAILAAGVAGDGVLSGCAVSQSANGPGMDVDVALGKVRIGGVVVDVSAQLDEAIGSGDATNPRFDLVEVGSDGTVDVTAGTAARHPVPPSPSAGHVALAQVWVDSSESTSIVTADIIDKRAMLDRSQTVTLAVAASDVATAIADGDIAYVIPDTMDGLNLTGVLAVVHTAGTTGTLDVQVRRRRGVTDADMLSTKCTVDTTETDSSTAATAAVIDGANDDVQTADAIYIDIDAIHTGTAANGLSVSLTFGA